MPRVFTVAIALLLLIGAASVRPSSRLMALSDGKGGAEAGKRPAQRATLKPVAAPSPDIPFNDYDQQAEEVLLNLANQARAKAGLHSLMLDAGLCQAARAHAQAMMAAHQLSHQFDGDLPLPHPLAAITNPFLHPQHEHVA